jgi:2-methylcitrate dehydratase PrpD
LAAALIPIMDKVKVVANQEFEALFPKFQPSRVTITTTSGDHTPPASMFQKAIRAIR